MTSELERVRGVSSAVTALVRALGKVAETDGPLVALHLTHKAVGELEAELQTRVAGARMGNASWTQVGNELGISRQTAFARYASIDPKRWDGTSPRCAAADLLNGDTEPCEGDQDAAWVLDSVNIPSEDQKRRDGILACVHHGSQLYARYAYARVYPTGGPDDPRRAALEIYHRAQVIKDKENAR